MKTGWTENIKDGWHRQDMAYAGKDHTKPRSNTFICMGPFEGQERTGFKTLEEAMNEADKLWPMKTFEDVKSELLKKQKSENKKIHIE